MAGPEPIIPRSDIESALSKVQSYVKTTHQDPNLQITPADWYGRLQFYVELPKDFPLNTKNKNEVAAFARAIHAQDPELTVMGASTDRETGQLKLTLRSDRWVDVNLDERNSDEAKRLSGYGEEFKTRLTTAIKSIGTADIGKQADGVEQQLSKEQAQVNEIYRLARTGTKEAFKTNDHVGLLVMNRTNNTDFVFRYIGAIDGAEDSGKFGPAAKSASEIQFDIPDASTKAYRLEKDGGASAANTHIYFDAVKRAYQVQANAANGAVAGVRDYYDANPQRDEETNGAKMKVGHAINKQNNDHAAEHNAQVKGPILSLMSDDFLFPKDAQLLTAGRAVANDPNQANYYATRYQDGTPENTKEALLKRYTSLDKAPNIDITGTSTEPLLYFSQDMGARMYQQAKKAYEAQAPQKTGPEIPALQGVIGHGNDMLPLTVNNKPAASIVSR